MHQRNPEIVELARLIGRTPSAVGMKASNFASMDPSEAARGIAGLGNASRADRALWVDFLSDPQSLIVREEGGQVETRFALEGLVVRVSS